jgi:hypothetical protein
MIEQKQAKNIIDSLRSRIPPIHGVKHFSLGNETLLQDIKNEHLDSLEDQGIIRFISGSWGSGKTHFFRLMRELALEEKCLVSNVELSANSAALNKLEQVFSEIIRNITTPTSFSQNQIQEINSHRHLLNESLNYLANENRYFKPAFTYEEYEIAQSKLIGDQTIDIDFRKMVRAYWSTFLPDSAGANQDQRRAEILQWFTGEGTISQYRRFQVTKLINRSNFQIMLQSLVNFVKLVGYKGLVILFDEAEQSYSVMSKSALKDAHNNLLALINGIKNLPGLYLIYATTPDFYNDPKHGAQLNGALASRVGKPNLQTPIAIRPLWNFDATQVNLADYQAVASKILNIYTSAYPNKLDDLPSHNEVQGFVSDLYSEHSEYAGVSFWRVMVHSLIMSFDEYTTGSDRTAQEIYISVMDNLKED